MISIEMDAKNAHTPFASVEFIATTGNRYSNPISGAGGG